jgi:hypothetical protein
MQTSKWLDRTETSDARADRIGIGASFVVLFMALVLIGIRLVSAPSFEKCSALGAQSERSVCYENLRDELLKLPAKGGSPPALNNSN